MKKCITAAAAFALLLTLHPRAILAAGSPDCRGVQFVGFTNFSAFSKDPGSAPGETLWVSPEIPTSVIGDQIVLSWNTDTNTHLLVEIRALYAARKSAFYKMGSWSSDPSHFSRASFAAQKDTDGEVSTDTLILHNPADRFRIRLTLSAESNCSPNLKFLGVCVCDTHLQPPLLEPDKQAWGQTIPVLERSQMRYPHGNVLCSPTTVSMLLSYWSGRLHRPGLDHDVPEVASSVYDSQWKAAGNWPFNMAYAGSFPGMRAYVARFTDVSELEAWIAKGLPVGLSVCYDRLRGKGPGPNGHLVVCVGFTPEGDVILNDPGTTLHVRKIFPRKNLIYAWANSHNTVYLVYPEAAELPENRLGHFFR